MKTPTIGAALFIIVLGLVASIAPITLSFDQTNVSTRVNITQAMPEILAITINNGSNVILNEGSTQNTLCNVTIRDYNGFADIDAVNATLYDYFNSTFASPDDNNDHYTNSSCIFLESIDAVTAVYECGFDFCKQWNMDL
jgi:hypothetical protein